MAEPSPTIHAPSPNPGAAHPVGALGGHANRYSNIVWRLGAAILSGLLMALATRLDPAWWAAWLAPIPLLLACFHSSLRVTWLWVAVASLIGLAGRFGYDLMFVGPAGEAIIALLLILFTGSIVSLTRVMVLRRHPLQAIFFYPAAMAGLGTILAAVSPHGTAGSLAYSQMTFLPAIQIATLAGIAGIHFTLALFAALVAVAWYCRAEAQRRWLVYGVPSLVIVAVLGYGVIRLGQGEGTRTLPVGLAVADDASPTPGAAIDPDDKSWKDYATTIPGLAEAGAKIVVWPEKIAPLDAPGVERTRKLLSDAARAAGVYLLAGVTIAGTDHLENHAWLFAPSGGLIADYAKQHLVPGFESRFKPGADDIVVSILGTRLGIAICKDMDFAQLGRAYSRIGVSAMLVPGYDFDVDGWSHASLAVLRGVEGGFGIVRPARHGLLIVTDRYGRVLARKASADARVVTLTTQLPLRPAEATVYARGGYAFGWLCLAFAIAAAINLAGGRTNRPEAQA